VETLALKLFSAIGSRSQLLNSKAGTHRYTYTRPYQCGH